MNPTLEALKALPGFNIDAAGRQWSVDGGQFIRRADAIAALQAKQEQEPDLVTRESALQAVEHVEQSNSTGRADDARKMLVGATPETSQWVSVKERLPEKAGYVWAYRPKAGIFAIFEIKFDGKRFESFHDVTHWMRRYIPKPPIDSTDAGDKHE